ncbi:MAG: indole-3-glycerol phosphate synthase TrpC [Candidatus Daviesbacteria bacterium]|nr:indole-3-glycerol phosphate synthase TrpC [Candidatus Daviesbacteria bacterium]
MQARLQEILNKTKKDLTRRKQKTPVEVLKKSLLKTQARSFINAIDPSLRSGTVAIIAEIKLASPTQTHLGNAKDLILRVKHYEQAGADCISIVTEKHFFKGNPTFVKRVKQVISLPILQKDFIIDSYQLYEAKKDGADALLLIAKILSQKTLVSLVSLAKKINLEPVVEVNSEDDLKKAILTKTQIIAVNARDLDTFIVNIDRACNLLKKIPNKFIKLGFSGVLGKDEAEKYKISGANGILIGTSLMRAKNIQNFLLSLRATERSVAI